MIIEPDVYQRNVIKSNSKDILVLAGAGSGKTYTLLSRILRLVSYNKIDPECILVLTFTRVASENMRSRYLKMMDSCYDLVPDFCTFHSFCYKIMQEYPGILKKCGFSTVPQIADESDMSRYMMRARDLSSCKLSYSTLQHPEKLSGKDKRSFENYKRTLSKILKSENVIDYDTLSQSICDLISSHDTSADPVFERYKYLFVDEFQDTDKYQFQFVESMDRCKRVLCGDALQNIYQFRGCSNAPLKRLIDDESWVKYELPINYRSSSQICNFVNTMSSKFKSSKYRIELQSTKPGPSVRICDKEDNNYDNLFKFIQVTRKHGSVAVLCRTNAESDRCSEEMSKRGIESSRQRDPEYDVSLIKSLESDDYKIKFIQQYMNEYEYSTFRSFVLQGADLNDVLTPEFFVEGSSCYRVLQDLNILKGISLVENLDEQSFMICNLFNIEKPNFNVQTHEQLIQYTLNRVQNRPVSKVHIGTIHSVKGLEFDSVAVMGVNSKSFQIDNEEKENLLYTACTRAKKNLILFCDE